MEAVAFHSPSGGSSLVIVEGNIAGHPANFELDTGAALPFVVLISPELAREAGAAPLREAEQQAPGAIGPARVVNRPVRLASFRIGPVRLDNVRAAVTPGLAGIGENVGARIDALIGATFLARRIIAIDYVRHTVDFEAQPGEAVRAISFTFAPRRPLPLVKVRLNGRGPFTFILDTGATTTVLKPSTAAAANIIGTGSTRVVGLGGVAEARAFRTRGELSVGQRAPQSTALAVADVLGQADAASGAHIDGILGADYLAGSLLTIDFRTRRLWLEDGRPARCPRTSALPCG